MLHRLLHDIEKKYHQIKNALVSIFQLFILTATGNMSLCGLKKRVSDSSFLNWLPAVSKLKILLT